MSYLEVDEVKNAIDDDRLNQIAADANKTVEEIVVDAIGFADSVIDGKIQKVMDVPVTSPPNAVKFIKEIAKKLAKHWLYDRSDSIPEEVKDGFKWAEKQLDDIRDGKTTFEKTSDLTPGVTVYNPYDQNVFTKGFIK